jgi:type I restriction enzyme S subunit
MRTVAQLGEWTGGGTPPKGVASYWAGDVPWVSPKDMNGDVIQGSEDRLTELGAALVPLHQPGDIAVVFRSGILRHAFPVARSAVRFAANQDIKVLHAAPDVDPGYAFHLLQGLESHVLNSAVKVGTTVESIDSDVFFRTTIRVPEPQEQRRVAAVLDSVDGAIQTTDDLVAKMRKVYAGLAMDLLANGVDQRGHLRTEFAQREAFKDSPLGRAPRSWQIAPLAAYGSPHRRGSRGVGALSRVPA